MAEAQQRDDISDLITMTGYQAHTLTGGQELLSRSIPCVNNISLDSAIGSSLTFRVLASSGRTLMRSKVLMHFPLKFSALGTRQSGGLAIDTAGLGDGAQVVGGNGDWTASGHRNICPRKSCGLQMCRQISVTTNSSVSQSTRPGEWLESMDDLFGNSANYVLPGEGAQESGRYDSFCVAQLEDGNYGGTDGTTAPVVGTNSNNRNRFINVFTNETNQGADYRRRRFQAGVQAADGQVIHYTAVSCVPLSPFMHYKYPSMYRKNAGPMIPYCDQLEINVNFKSNVKPWLLQGFRRSENKGATVLENYTVAWAARPYLKVIFTSTPLQIPPSITVPSNRFVNYEVVKTVAAAPGTTFDVAFNSLRFEVWPDLIVIQAQETDAKREAYAGEAGIISWKPYFCPLVENSLRVTIGERSSLLNGMSNRELFSFYRRNAPSSDMSYETWEKYRTQVLIRNDMVSHTSCGVFDPVTASFEMSFKKDQDHLASETDYVCRLQCWYFSDALTLAPASSSQSSFMISSSDVDVAKAVGSAATRAQTAIQAYASGGGY